MKRADFNKLCEHIDQLVTEDERTEDEIVRLRLGDLRALWQRLCQVEGALSTQQEFVEDLYNVMKKSRELL